MKTLQLFFFLTVLIMISTLDPVSAVEIPHSKEKTDAVLQKIIQCSSSAQNPSALYACAKEDLSQSLSLTEKNDLLAWFQRPYKLKAARLCTTKELKYLPEELTGKEAQTICSEFDLASRKKTAMFFFVTENKKLRLRNIREN